TNCRSSSQIGQRSGGFAVSENCVPHCTQMKFSMSDCGPVISSELERSLISCSGDVDIQRLTRSSPDSLAATLAAQPSMSLSLSLHSSTSLGVTKSARHGLIPCGEQNRRR